MRILKTLLRPEIGSFDLSGCTPKPGCERGSDLLGSGREQTRQLPCTAAPPIGKAENTGLHVPPCQYRGAASG